MPDSSPQSSRQVHTLKPKAYQGKIYHCLGQSLVKEKNKTEETIEFAYYENGLLLVNAQGKIDACGEYAELSKQFDLSLYHLEKLNPKQLLLPGLIDLHVHLPQLLITGCEEKTLLDWLERHVFPEESKFSDESYARVVSQEFFKQLLKNGTTTAAVFLTSHPSACEIAFQEAEQSGNRVVMGLNLMDTHGPDVLIDSLTPASDFLLAETEKLFLKWHGKNNGKLRYAWMPRFALSCSPELLDGIGQLRKKYPEAYLHTHLSEQPSELTAVLEAFPWAENYTDIYHHYGLLGPKTILAHGIHLHESERKVIQQQHACIAHCPSSNFFLKSGRFPWQTMSNEEILFGLGSDVGAGPDLSMIKTMRDAQYMQPEHHLSVHHLVYRATLGAAEALEMAKTIGNFEAGKDADFIIVAPSARIPDIQHPLAPQAGTIEQHLAHLIYTGDERAILKTVIAGETVFQRG